MSIDISVVIPVYNSERYLRECIESLLCQTLQTIEMIFVDDGSKDGSVKIIEEYQKRDNRIQLIKQTNQYAGVARNNGMKRAIGKYISFLDSDDFFEPNMLEEAFRCAEKKQAEITIFSYSKYDDKNHTIEKIKFPPFPQEVFSMDDMKEDFLLLYRAMPWNKLFLRSFICEHKLEFPAIKKWEDLYFTHMAALLAKRMAYLKKRLIFYRFNNPKSLQGDRNWERAAFVESLMAIRSKMIESGMFNGRRKEAYLYYAKYVIQANGTTDNAQLDSMRQYYQRIKDALIPGLFESIEEFEDDPWIMHIYEGSLESLLLYHANELTRQLYEQNRKMVSKKNKDYMIGHFLMFVPRKIYTFVKHK